MEAENQNRSRRYNDPLVMGAGALVLGFTIGSGRWNWLSQHGMKIVEGLGVLGLTYLTQAFQSHNSRFFYKSSEMIH